MANCFFNLVAHFQIEILSLIATTSLLLLVGAIIEEICILLGLVVSVLLSLGRQE